MSDVWCTRENRPMVGEWRPKKTCCQDSAAAFRKAREEAEETRQFENVREEKQDLAESQTEMR